jgi:hypothetical protein
MELLSTNLLFTRGLHTEPVQSVEIEKFLLPVGLIEARGDSQICCILTSELHQAEAKRGEILPIFRVKREFICKLKVLKVAWDEGKAS